MTTTRRAGEGPRPLSGPVPEDVTYSIAQSREERAAAFRLVHQSYVQKGLVEPNSHGMRITPFHLLPTTTTFNATYRGNIVCTLTLIGDGDLGLPMESIYGDEVNAAREQGLFVGEVSCLAVREIDSRCFLPVFIKLTRLMAQFARLHGMDQFLIATHPKHGRLYKRFMGFDQIGPFKEYPTVSNAPAVAYCLDFSRVDRDQPACYDQYFGSQIPRERLVRRPISPEDNLYFGRFVEAYDTSIPLTV